jgi:GNAT superfamily N-acetyltransferase
MAEQHLQVRAAVADDAGEIARLLYDFNTEYDEPTPPIPVLTERLRDLLAAAEISVFLVGDPPFAIALMRFRPSIWGTGPDAYLEELYVAPARRGRGTGRALMEAALELARSRGSEHLDLVTSEDDTRPAASTRASG